jgi:hypothetical protein
VRYEDSQWVEHDRAMVERRRRLLLMLTPTHGYGGRAG